MLEFARNALTWTVALKSSPSRKGPDPYRNEDGEVCATTAMLTSVYLFLGRVWWFGGKPGDFLREYAGLSTQESHTDARSPIQALE